MAVVDTQAEMPNMRRVHRVAEVSAYAVPVESPPGLVQCPVHGSLVAVADGYLIGRCDQCCEEVAQGLAWLKKHPIRRKR